MDLNGSKDGHQQVARRFQVALERARERRQTGGVLSYPPRVDALLVRGVAWLDQLASAEEAPPGTGGAPSSGSEPSR